MGIWNPGPDATPGNDQFTGNSSAETANGGDGDDTLSGDGGNDGLAGGKGNDTLDGGDGDDALSGGDENDILNGGANNDTLNGDAGNDVLNGGDGNDSFNGGTGADTTNGGAGDDTFGVYDEFDTIDGGEGMDNVSLLLGAAASGVTVDLTAMWTGGVGQIGAGTITNVEFVHTLSGGAFDDVLIAGLGATNTFAISGLGGNDQIAGSNLYDQIFGDDGNDTLSGNGGHDSLSGGLGGDTLNGGDGDDALGGGADNDILNGGANNDTLNGDAGNDVLNGGDGNDSFNGGTGADTTNGGAGDDTFGVYDEFDTIDGGEGSDNVSFLLHGAVSGITVDLTAMWTGGVGQVGSGTITNVEFVHTLSGGAFDDVLIAGLGATNTFAISGLGGNDQIAGSNLAEQIFGDDGNDTLSGNGGGDSLSGGLGGDTLNGGDGDDALGGGADNDILNGGANNDTLNGDAGNDVLNGGDGNDSFNGGTGADTTNGGAGDDSFGVYDEFDTIDGGEGMDNVSLLLGAAASGVTVDLTAMWTGGVGQIGAGTITNVEFVHTLSGGAFDDVLIAGLGATNAFAISGLGGNDLIVGSNLAEQIDGGDGDDTLSGNIGNDNLLGQAGQDDLRGDDGSDVLSGGVGGDGLDGGDGADALSGDDGDDYLLGNHGVDTLNGGAGFDILVGGIAEMVLFESFQANPLGGPAILVRSWGSGRVVDDGVGDLLNGGDGDDLSTVGVGDSVNGGNGNDLVAFDLSHLASGVTLDFSVASGAADLATLIGASFLNTEYYDGTATEHDDTVILGGSLFNTSLLAGAGNDTITATTGRNSIYGEDGADVISGADGDDQLYANNVITAEFLIDSSIDDGHVDLIDARGGNDQVTVGLGDVADGGAGTDTLWVTLVDRLTGVTLDLTTPTLAQAELASASGGQFSNFERFNVIATDQADVIVGGQGVSNIRSGGGNDTLTSTSTSGVFLAGGDGDDVLNGGAGNDGLFTGSGNNSVFGNNGNDRIYLGWDGSSLEAPVSGANTVDGGVGYDIALVDDFVPVTDTGVFRAILANVEEAWGGSGSDWFTFQDNAGFRFALGGDGDDRLEGGGGDEELYGDAGDDILRGGLGNDYLEGSDGLDTASYADATLGVQVDLNLGVSQNTIGAGNDTLVDIENLTGSGFDDALYGNAQSNVLTGGLGNDLIDGRGGDDVASYADAATAVVVNLAITTNQNTGGAGTDRLVSIEGVAGSSFNDTLTGNSGTNTLSGGLGDDVLSGGAGNDVIFDTAGVSGVVSINAGTGDDRIALSGAFLSGTVNGGNGLDQVTASGNVSGLTFVGVETLNTGGGTVTATAAQLRSFATIQRTALDTAGAINLALSAGGVLNLANKAVGRDINLTGSAGVDTLTGSSGNDVIDGGASGDTLNGGDGNDTLTGGDGPDRLDGGEGNDTLLGGTGNDTLLGGAGNDAISDTGGAIAAITAGLGDDIITLGTTLTSGTVNGGGGADQVNVSGFLRDVVYVGVETLNTNGGLVTATAVQMEAFETIRVSAADMTGAVSLRLSAAGTINLAGELGTRAVTFTGSTGNDIITTGDGADTITGGSGNDSITARSGNDLILQSSTDGRDVIDGGIGADTYRLTGTAAAETFRIYTRAEALAAGMTGLAAGTEIVITRDGTTNATIIAELDNIEEIEINSLVSTANNGDGVVDGGSSGGDTIMVIGDFTSSSLAYSTIHIEGSSAADTVDITGLTSAHRVVFDSHGGTDTILGDVRSQDVFNGVDLNDQRGGATSTMIEEPAAPLSFGASDGLDALVRSSIRDLLQADLLRNDFGLGRGHTLRTELGGLAQDSHGLNDVLFGNDFDSLFSGLGRTMVETADDLSPLDFSTHASEALHAAPVFAALELSGFGQRYVSSDYDVLPA